MLNWYTRILPKVTAAKVTPHLAPLNSEAPCRWGTVRSDKQSVRCQCSVSCSCVLWTAMDRVRASSSVILWIGK